MPIRVAILTVSDRSSKGERPDTSGVALAEAVAAQGWEVSARGVVPDEQAQISSQLIEWCDSQKVDLILTTGGTGFAPRDITPEATQAIIHRSAPGLIEAMRSESLKVTPHGMLSRAVAGIRGKTIIINLPGNPKGAVENLQVVLAVIPHAVELLQEHPQAEAHHRII
ncbi:MAG: MogA/MoaB family molybdenum cofactor biosynthesis protein [Chloroflexi bacterium]|nr:MogA/MoaB family molybdenum cofactor biosynthesis protein [Chloroflexota bacterium]